MTATPSAVAHMISVDGDTVCRDGRPVKVVAIKEISSLKVGCTFISQAAMLRLFDLYVTCNESKETVLQKGGE